jgi:hypothetical protein
MRQGDAMYMLASGRLRVSMTGADGEERVVREITRGQVVGEMSLVTGEPRSATLVAMRDSVLARPAAWPWCWTRSRPRTTWCCCWRTLTTRPRLAPSSRPAA